MKTVNGDLFPENTLAIADTNKKDNEVFNNEAGNLQRIKKDVMMKSENGNEFVYIDSGNTDGDPNTYFTDFRGSLNQGGAWYQQFTIPSGNVGFVLRLATKYATDAAVFLPSQLNNFLNNNTFSGYGSFDNQFGYNYFVLGPGTYYVGVRNQASALNYVSLELDFQIRLSSNNGQYYAEGINNKTIVQNNYYYWHQFSIQSGYRYFMDGCNSGMDVYIIPYNQLSNFNSGNTFQYYTAYSGTNDASQPGFYEINLPNGNYFLAVRNFTGSPQTLVYNTEIWRLVGITELNSEIPERFKLSQNYPNPFNPETKINFDIVNSGFVKLKVYDMLGKEVATLVNENLSAGSYETNFDGSNLTSGIYFYRLEAGDFSEVKRMMLIK